MRSRFLKLSAIVLSGLLVVIATSAGVGAQQMATGTPGGSIPCPTMSATESAMMPTMSSTEMSGMMATTEATMDMSAMSGMLIGPYTPIQGCSLNATLSGANEVPGPGDPKGMGTAVVTVSNTASGPGVICVEFAVSGMILPATAAHIHMGGVGTAGPDLVPLAAPDANGKTKNCTTGVDPAIIAAILAQPSNYYVNVHNADYPNGAIRGQLMAAMP